MKNQCIVVVGVLLFLSISIALVSCGEDPKQEQERIKYVQDWNARVDPVEIWAHGPGHKYATFDVDIPIGTAFEDQLKELEVNLTMPAYTQLIEIGFEKLFWSFSNRTFEFYVDKKENCWKFK